MLAVSPDSGLIAPCIWHLRRSLVPNTEGLIQGHENLDKLLRLSLADI